MNETPIRLHRLQAGKTQRSVADEAGITWTYYQRLEAGLQIPSVEIAQRIAAALNTHVGELWPVEPIQKAS